MRPCQHVDIAKGSLHQHITASRDTKGTAAPQQQPEQQVLVQAAWAICSGAIESYVSKQRALCPRTISIELQTVGEPEAVLLCC